MAADLATTATSGLRVQACGDAHLMNFGGFATPERHVIFDINDLDETLPAPFEWDLKRLAASVVIAAQHLELAYSEPRILCGNTASGCTTTRLCARSTSGMTESICKSTRIGLAIPRSLRPPASGSRSESKRNAGRPCLTIYIRSL
jgi:uncharacterized protein (DUF2252 family)